VIAHRVDPRGSHVRSRDANLCSRTCGRPPFRSPGGTRAPPPEPHGPQSNLGIERGEQAFARSFPLTIFALRQVPRHQIGQVERRPFGPSFGGGPVTCRFVSGRRSGYITGATTVTSYRWFADGMAMDGHLATTVRRIATWACYMREVVRKRLILIGPANSNSNPQPVGQPRNSVQPAGTRRY